MHTSEPDLHPWVICAEDGNILAGHCTCIAGLGEVCSHVGAILFYCELVTKENEKRSVTDQPAYWALPTYSAKTSKALFSPMTRIKSISYGSAKTTFKEGQKKTIKKKFSVDKRRFPLRPIHDKKTFQEFLKQVGSIRPNSVALKFSGEFVEDRTKCFPFVLNKLFKPEHQSLNLHTLICLGKSLKFNLKKNDFEIIEKLTRRQNRTNLWRQFRLGRITASIAWEVCHVKAADSNKSLIKRICYPSATQLRKKAVLWGCEHEKDALAAYLQINAEKHNRLQVTRCGFFVHENFQFMGASPDGLVECKCCGVGVLELKCPYCIEEADVSTLKYLEKTSSGLSLKEESNYFYQIQMQMMCTGHEYADFFVWSPNEKNYHYERIQRKPETCQKIVLGCVSFFYNSVIPELLAAYYTK